MAAASGDGNQPPPQQQQVKGEDFPKDQQPPIAGAASQEHPSTPERPGEISLERPPSRRGRSKRRRSRSRSRVRRIHVSAVAQKAARALMLWRLKAEQLLQWFGARPLGQRALEAVGHTIATAERATLWAGTATAYTDRRPLPYTWFVMMAITMALMVIRIGAALIERYLDVQLPQNRDLLNWLQKQRLQLEQIRTAAAVNIHVLCVDENDPIHNLMHTWPFNIPYMAAQQLGLIPVIVTKQRSDTESSSVPTLEPMKSSSSSGLSTVLEAEEHAAPSSREQPSDTESSSVPTLETVKSSSSSASSTVLEAEHAAPSSRELTPPPETAGDKSVSFNPDGERQKEESETGEQQDDKSEGREGEKPREEKLTPLPETAGDESLYFSPDGERQIKQESKTEEQKGDRQEEVEGEKVHEQKTEEPPKIIEEEAIGAATAVLRPQPSASPEHPVSKQAERAAMGVVRPPTPLVTSEDLLAAERTSHSQPGMSSTEDKASASFAEIIDKVLSLKGPRHRYVGGVRGEAQSSEKSTKF